MLALLVDFRAFGERHRESGLFARCNRLPSTLTRMTGAVLSLHLLRLIAELDTPL